ncbi:MAG: LysR family transcriptional regulator, partial [Caulobacteraceae bacterium]
MDRFESLNTFRHVVEAGRFAAAARALNASKATVSKRI